KSSSCQISCRLFEISGQRFAKFAVDLNDAIRNSERRAFSSPRSIPPSPLLRVIVPRTSAPLSTACRPYNRLRLRRRSREPSPVSELAPWGRVLSEQVLAWVPRLDWESSPEYRWVPSRVDERESRGISLIEKAGLPDQLTAVLLKQRLHFLQNSVR